MARKIGKSYALGTAQESNYGTGKFREHRTAKRAEAMLKEQALEERDELGLFQKKMLDSRFMLIEAKEHQHLLRLYYAVYDEAKAPSAATEEACLQALERCNTFYAGGELWH